MAFPAASDWLSTFIPGYKRDRKVEKTEKGLFRWKESTDDSISVQKTTKLLRSV